VNSVPKPPTSRDKVRAHRERLRAQGLKPLQLWVPDVNAAGFASAARRQSRAVGASANEKDEQAFVDAMGEPLLWEEPEAATLHAAGGIKPVKRKART
jgi:hypothetical protein